jgi:hypothetical protein
MVNYRGGYMIVPIHRHFFNQLCTLANLWIIFLLPILPAAATRIMREVTERAKSTHSGSALLTIRFAGCYCIAWCEVRDSHILSFALIDDFRSGIVVTGASVQ